MRLFKTTSRRTYHRPQATKRGWSTTLTAKTRLKRWAKRRTKQLWRTAKRRTKRLWRKTKQRVRRGYRSTKRLVRRRWKKYQRQRPGAIRRRQIARNAQQFRRHNAEIHRRQAEQPNVGMLEGQAQPPLPPDGATATCRRCSNEVQYNGGRERWEHTGRGHYECFQPRRD